MAGEGLGGGDADFRAYVEVYAGIGFAGDGGADGVDDAEGERAAVLGFAEGGEGVGGFAGLAHGDDDGAILDDGIAVTEFGGVFDFGGDFGEIFHEVFADEAGMPCGAAAGDDDTACADEFTGVGGETAEDDAAFVQINAAAQAIFNGAGLLEDFLEHEMFVVAEFHLFEFEFGFLDFGGDGDVVDGHRLEVAGADHRHFVVVEIDDLGGVFDDGGGVGGDDVFAVAHTDDQGAAAARDHEGVGFIGGHDGDAVGAACFVECGLDGFGEGAAGTVAFAGFVEVGDEHGEHFGIGLAGEGVAFSSRKSLRVE